MDRHVTRHRRSSVRVVVTTVLVVSLQASSRCSQSFTAPSPRPVHPFGFQLKCKARTSPVRLAGAAAERPPPSQVEDLVANAKSLIYAVYPKGPQAAWRNALAGFAVSLAMIPESVAFAFVAGVTPIVGLWSAAVVGFFAAAFGGRAGIASGAAGSTAVVMTALVTSCGTTHLSAAVILAGLIQIGVGILSWGKFISLVPHPVMLGFVNGLAIVIFRAQLSHFLDPLTGSLLTGTRGATMLGLTALSMALVKLLPKVTTAIPSSLLTVGTITALTHVLHLPATTLVDIAGKETFQGGLAMLPTLAIPAVPWLSAPLSTLGTLLPYAATMAAVGLVESLLTLQLVDGLVEDGRRGNTSKECIGQGLGNVFSGLTGGMGGCAMIGQTQVNVQAGATSRLAGISMSLILSVGIVGAAPLLGKVPIAALVGIMFVVCESTFEWSSLRIMGKIPRTDALIIVLVSLVTVVKDLAIAVVVGTILSALNFAWEQSKRITAITSSKDAWKTYQLSGPLFFGSTQAFGELFDSQGDPADVVIDFAGTRVLDHSALEAINGLADRYGALGKRLHLRHLSSDCAALLERLNGRMPPYELVEPEPARDPIYEVSESSALYADVPPPVAPAPEAASGEVEEQGDAAA